MKKIYILIFISSTFWQCAEPTAHNSIPQPYSPFEELSFGTDITLEIITWNLEEFPKAYTNTVSLVTQAIRALDVDIIALQEIESSSYFQNLVDSLDGWSGYKANSASYNIDLAFLYKTSVIENINIYEIYTNDSRPFPRSPLVLEFEYNSENYAVINNHLKCCGNGTIDFSDDWDEDHRRLDAMNLLHDYVSTSFDQTKVIIVGDFNDEIDDANNNNVFLDFINNPDEYLVTDFEIVEYATSRYDLSYPNWESGSHIDHIIITNELFDNFEVNNNKVTIFRLKDYLDGGWSEYDSNISDHQPIGIKLEF